MLATRQCLSWHFPSIRGPLLRARRERPRDRPAPNERDELTPPHVEHSFSLRVSSSGLLGRQRAFRPARIPTEGSRRGPRRNKARLQRCRKPNLAASLQPAQSWWISLGSQITRTDRRRSSLPPNLRVGPWGKPELFWFGAGERRRASYADAINVSGDGTYPEKGAG